MLKGGGISAPVTEGLPLSEIFLTNIFTVLEVDVKKLLLLVVLCLFLPSFIFAADKGIITGVIVDGKTGEPLIDAGVEVVETGKKVFTDLDGKYSLELPSGKYEIRVFYPQYQGQRVMDVTVTSRKPARIDLSLAPGAADVEVVEVVVEAAKAAEATQLLIRKNAPAVTDSVSAETMSKQPDSDVAAVVARAPGITVVDDKFVYIRGLGERYTSASLNSAALPTTQTEKKVVPLNLFSADVIESINVIKSYTPDLPGEFTAGMVQINTKDYPDTFEMKFSASAGYNSETTGKDFKTYKGGDTDWLAMDDGTRELPDNVPDKKIISTTENLEKIGEDFPNIWNTETETATPSYGGNFHIGNKYDKFGIVFDLGYDADFQTRKEKLFEYINPKTTFDIRRNLDLTYWEKTYNWNSILNMGYKLSPNHKISFKNFYTRKAKDEVRESEGFVEENAINTTDDKTEINTKDTRLYWSEESIYSGQLLGDHRVEALKSRINWKLGYGHSTLDEPDTRTIRYTLREAPPGIFEFKLYTGDESGLRTFTELDEDLYEGGFDWEIDLKEWVGHPIKAKFGPNLSYRYRTFDHRRFNFASATSNFTGIDTTQDPESIFDPKNIGGGSASAPGVIRISESTRKSDHYDADHMITAGYLMADTPYFFFEKLRFVGGLRVEQSEQRLDSLDPQFMDPNNPGQPLPINVENDDTDYLPSANLIYSLSKDMNLRLGYSRTVNRPEFREMAPFQFTDVAAGEQTVGNTKLKRALIKSYDLRWEWFISSEELLALSFFYKGIEAPIEKVKQHTGGGTINTFQNSLKAENYGLEVEARKNLGFIHPLLSPFNVLANYTYVDSQVEIDPHPAGFDMQTIMTSMERPLQGQSDHVANVTLEYNLSKWDLTARLLYNYVGARISNVGTNDLPDIIEEPSEMLDFILIKRFGNLGLKLSAKNLLDEEVLFTQGRKVFNQYKEGRSFSFGLSYGI